MQEILNATGNLLVAMLDNPVGGWAAWAVITAVAAGWAYGGGPPPNEPPHPLPITL